jgi:uncharacterized protein (TIGR00730 family)
VYAGSATGNKPSFREAAVRFASELAAQGIELVYGGGAVGLMGAVADAALDEGGKVIGVIPQSLVDAEVAHTGLTELRVVESMHERKTVMAELGDAFIALPGGVGTVEELLEAWAWLILGHHSKPVTLLNVDGYWDRLLGMTRRMAVSGFMSSEEYETLVPVRDSAEFLATISSWKPPPPRWRAPLPEHVPAL